MAGGRIEPSAQPHLKHRQLQFSLSKGQEGGGRDQFKGRELVAPRHRCGRLQVATQHRRRNQIGPKAHALTPAHQVGRGVEPNAQARGQQPLVHQGGNRAFAVGASHLHRGKALFRMA